MDNPQLVFALIIGINKYHLSTDQNLHYARHDADRFQAFLIRSKVPLTNIHSLRDEEANRVTILNAFHSLITNESIAKDDPIVIYYAGHGGRIPKPEAWHTWPTYGPQIEIMCPSDIGTVVNGETVVGIPDRTISALLQELATAKGDNITLILDCCSSAGMSRSSLGRVTEGSLRQILNPPHLTADCDRGIWEGQTPARSGTRGLSAPGGFSGKHQGSHILLAACGVDQSAIELPRTGGIFTHQLLHILGKENIRDLTYISLMHKLQMPLSQTPHCEGRNVDRRLFNKHAPGANRSFSLGHHDEDAEKLVLDLGDAHGVTVGSVYEVHATILDPGPNNPRLCTLVVSKVEPLHSIMEYSAEAFLIPESFYARKLKDGPGKPFAVYCSNGDLIERLFFDQQSRDNFGLTSPDSASLSILVDETTGDVTFKRHHPLVVPHVGPSRFRSTVNIDDSSRLRNVVERAANFERHLKRSGEDMRNIWMEFRELKPGNNGMGQNLLQNDTAIVPIMRDFTLTIFNQTPFELYPHVFYLDPSDLSIYDWYTPAIGGRPGKSGRVDPPLLPESSLTLGYGDTNTVPWIFKLHPEDSVDVGFFKVFFTTSPSNFSTLIQDSPFDDPHSMSRGKQLNNPPSPTVEFWGTKLITIIHKRL